MYGRFLILAALLPFAAAALELAVTPGRETAVWKIGEPVQFRIAVTEKEQPLAGKKVSYSIQANDSDVVRGEFVSGEKPEVITFPMKKAGFVLLRAESRPEAGGKPVVAFGGAAVEPEAIRATTRVPDDFDRFWEEARAEVAAVPMKVTRTLFDDTNPASQIFDVQIDCAGGAPVSGYLSVPRDKSRKYSIRLSYDGAGVRSAYPPRPAGASDAIVFNVNAHGLPNGRSEEFYRQQSANELADYAMRGWAERDRTYFRGMYQRLMRAHEYVKSLPEWDGKNLIVSGGSQGGAQALVAAALDPDVTVMISWVTALCDLTGSLHGRTSGWPRPPVSEPGVAENSAYYDVANFATRVRPETACLMMVGFIDQICVPTSVYSAYNNLQVKEKMMVHDIVGGHRLSPEGAVAIGRFISSHMKK